MPTAHTAPYTCTKHGQCTQHSHHFRDSYSSNSHAFPDAPTCFWQPSGRTPLFGFWTDAKWAVRQAVSAACHTWLLALLPCLTSASAVFSRPPPASTHTGSADGKTQDETCQRQKRPHGNISKVHAMLNWSSASCSHSLFTEHCDSMVKCCWPFVSPLLFDTQNGVLRVITTDNYNVTARHHQKSPKIIL